MPHNLALFPKIWIIFLKLYRSPHRIFAHFPPQIWAMPDTTVKEGADG